MGTEPRLLADCDRPLRERYRTLLFDLDGVIYRGQSPVVHAVEAIGAARAAGCAVFFVTNNASRLPETVVGQLVDLGVPAEPHEVITSAQASAELLTSWVRAGRLPDRATVLMIGQDGLRRALTDAGFRLVASANDKPDVVVQGYGPDTAWTDLAEAAYAIGNGAAWLASNLDPVLPTERGFAPGNGALVQAVAMATGTRPEVAGKPERPLFDTALRATGADRADTLMIGDRLDSDIAGAVAAEVPSLLVLTGVSGLADLFDAPEPERPSFVAFDLTALAQSQPALALAPDQVTCGGWTVVCSSGSLRLHGDGSPTAALRASSAAAWRFSGANGSGPAREPLLRALSELCESARS